MATYQEQLNEVNAAISAIRNGAQEYQIGQRKLRRADLAVLIRDRDDLERKAFYESLGGGIIYYGSQT